MIKAADYYHRYIDLVKDQSITGALKAGRKNMSKFLKDMPGDKWDYAYEEGKWTVKQVVLHIIDTERVMAYRALRIGRGDQTALPGFEQDDYFKVNDGSARTPKSLVKEYKAVRKATNQLFKNFTEEDLARTGTASDNEISVAALGYIIAGHEIHHAEVIRERYGVEVVEKSKAKSEAEPEEVAQ